MASLDALGDKILYDILDFAPEGKSVYSLVSLPTVADKLALDVRRLHKFNRKTSLQSVVCKRFNGLIENGDAWRTAFAADFPQDVEFASQLPLRTWKLRYQYWRQVQHRWKTGCFPRYSSCLVADEPAPLYSLAAVPGTRSLLLGSGNSITTANVHSAQHRASHPSTSLTSATTEDLTLSDINHETTLHVAGSTRVGCAQVTSLSVAEGSCQLISGHLNGKISFNSLNIACFRDCSDTSRKPGCCGDVLMEAGVSVPAHDGPVMSISAAKHASLAVSASTDSNIIIWDTTAHEKVYTASCGAEICCAVMTDDGKLAVSGDKAGNVTAWDVEAQSELMRFEGFGQHWVWSIDAGAHSSASAAFPTRKTEHNPLPWGCASRMMADINEGLLSELSLSSTQPARTVATSPSTAASRSACASKPTCGVRKACAIVDRWTSRVMTQLCPAKRRACAAKASACHDEKAATVRSPTSPAVAERQGVWGNNSVLFGGCTDGCWRQYDIRVGACVASVYVDPKAVAKRDLPVSSVSYISQREQLITSSYDGAVRVWDLRMLAPVHELYHPRRTPLLRAVCLPDCVVATSVDGEMHCWSFL